MCHYLAFHSWDPYFKVVVEGTFNMENTFGMEDTYELDRLIGASPASASVLDIIAASSSRTLTKEASADYREATGEVLHLEGKSHRCDNLTGGD